MKGNTAKRSSATLPFYKRSPNSGAHTNTKGAVPYTTPNSLKGNTAKRSSAALPFYKQGPNSGAPFSPAACGSGRRAIRVCAHAATLSGSGNWELGNGNWELGGPAVVRSGTLKMHRAVATLFTPLSPAACGSGRCVIRFARALLCCREVGSASFPQAGSQ